MSWVIFNYMYWITAYPIFHSMNIHRCGENRSSNLKQSPLTATRNRLFPMNVYLFCIMLPMLPSHNCNGNNASTMREVNYQRCDNDLPMPSPHPSDNYRRSVQFNNLSIALTIRNTLYGWLMKWLYVFQIETSNGFEFAEIWLITD